MTIGEVSVLAFGLGAATCFAVMLTLAFISGKREKAKEARNKMWDRIFEVESEVRKATRRLDDMEKAKK